LQKILWDPTAGQIFRKGWWVFFCEGWSYAAMRFGACCEEAWTYSGGVFGAA
jgi:hypothetical protein